MLAAHRQFLALIALLAHLLGVTAGAPQAALSLCHIMVKQRLRTARAVTASLHKATR